MIYNQWVMDYGGRLTVTTLKKGRFCSLTHAGALFWNDWKGEVLVRVHSKDLYKQKRPIMLAKVQWMDLYEQLKSLSARIWAPKKTVSAVCIAFPGGRTNPTCGMVYNQWVIGYSGRFSETILNQKCPLVTSYSSIRHYLSHSSWLLFPTASRYPDRLVLRE